MGINYVPEPTRDELEKITKEKLRSLCPPDTQAWSRRAPCPQPDSSAVPTPARARSKEKLFMSTLATMENTPHNRSCSDRWKLYTYYQADGGRDLSEGRHVSAVFLVPGGKFPSVSKLHPQAELKPQL